MKTNKRPRKEDYENLINHIYLKALDDYDEEALEVIARKTNDMYYVGILTGYWHMLDAVKNELKVADIEVNIDLEKEVEKLMVRASKLYDEIIEKQSK